MRTSVFCGGIYGSRARPPSSPGSSGRDRTRADPCNGFAGDVDDLSSDVEPDVRPGSLGVVVAIVEATPAQWAHLGLELGTR
jgi:hypothetical protein